MGFALNGCIDGFSRRLMWLETGPSNNNPAVVAHYFVECVRTLEVVPMHMRTDCRTENGTLAAIQCTLRSGHNDYFAGPRSHMFGSSTSNQRIESWWSFFRKGSAQFWIQLFGDMQTQGHFNGSHEHQCLMRFCFGALIQVELQECRQLWNLHRVCQSRFSRCPGGIPDELYNLPHRYDSRDCGFPINIQDLVQFQQFTERQDICGDAELKRMFLQEVTRNNLAIPENWENGVELYLNLKELVML
ncbi:uncharacterized protein LOC115420206 [Sphaeramia orbicularis]|uniref:uncharacterized protein LOC115420206 n=1 Tax=Sphaeramia orbicularis TaxID=375764 RepID=UPI00117C8176|nr:uncharacterized protein LOC115420206 [Sphaeramia orbicularis]